MLGAGGGGGGAQGCPLSQRLHAPGPRPSPADEANFGGISTSSSLAGSRCACINLHNYSPQPAARPPALIRLNFGLTKERGFAQDLISRNYYCSSCLDLSSYVVLKRKLHLHIVQLLCIQGFSDKLSWSIAAQNVVFPGYVHRENAQ